MFAIDPGLLWWLVIAEAPMLVSVYWMLHGIRRDLDRPSARPPDGLERTREDLAGFKLEVARTYVPLSLIREVDRRLTEQLLRIEEKLEEMRRQQENRR
ncbi:hypothetical protein [Rubritepida flocculans]|uniref:hypothetical protein n=1 Tax=Rubritepida flocculans TaxID=182403 RepID=UPI000421E012|nr:hypothetical protein [Rubritepida flocculans]